MVPRRLLLPLLPAVLGLAACGGSGTPVAQAPTPAAPQVKTSGKALRVGGTDLRLGGARVDDGTGAKDLAGPSRPDPKSLRERGRRRDGVGAGDSCPDQDLMPAPENLGQVVASTLCLLNGQRADAGLGPLAQNDELAQAAVRHSTDMVAASYFAHDDPDGTTSTDRIRATGYIPTDRAWTVGENLAWGTGNLATPRNIVVAWMNSPGHRANILRPEFNEIGFGVLVGNPRTANGQGATYTTTFGSLGGSKPVAVEAQAPAATPAASTGPQAKVKGTKSSSAKSKRARARRAKAARRRAVAARKRAHAARQRAHAARRKAHAARKHG